MMNSRELFLKTCKREPVPRPPVWLMRQVGRYMPEYQRLRRRFSFIEMITKPDVAAEVTLFASSNFDPDGLVVFSDILPVIASMGAELNYQPKLSVKADLGKLHTVPDESWLTPVYETLRIVKGEVGDEKAVIGFAGAPYTLLYYLMGHGDEIRSILLLEEEASLDILNKIANIVALHLRRQAEAGADVLQIFDSHSGDIPPELYRRFALTSLRFVLKKLEDINLPIILFARGRNLFESRESLSDHVLSVDWTVPLDSVPDAAKFVIQGNLDPVVLLGGPKLTREETEKMLRRCGKFGGHIANLGHGVLPNTPMANVREFVDTVKHFSMRN